MSSCATTIRKTKYYNLVANASVIKMMRQVILSNKSMLKWINMTMADLVGKANSVIYTCMSCLQKVEIRYLANRSGGRLNKKDGLTRYGDSHVKDKTAVRTWKSPYVDKTLFILRRGAADSCEERKYLKACLYWPLNKAHWTLQIRHMLGSILYEQRASDE